MYPSPTPEALFVVTVSGGKFVGSWAGAVRKPAAIRATAMTAVAILGGLVVVDLIFIIRGSEPPAKCLGRRISWFKARRRSNSPRACRNPRNQPCRRH